MSLILFLLFFFVLSCISYSEHIKCNHETGTFRIVQLTDTHFGESTISDYLTLSTINHVLEVENPDLVVLSGDIISGVSWNGYVGWFEKQWDKLVQILIKHNVKWIYTPGNHDADGEWNTSQIIQNDITKYSHLGSHTKIGFMDKEHQQNAYYVTVYNDDEIPVSKIWMFDSGSLDCHHDYDCYGCIHLSQMQWYEQQTHDIPGLVFVHIPIPQIINYHLTKQFNFIGHFDEELSCFSETELGDKTFVDYILENNDIIGIIHGHEHEHDSIMLYKDDLMIAFGRKTSRSFIMGMETRWKLNAGARVIEFNCNDPKTSWKSWIRDLYDNVEYHVSYVELIKHHRYSNKSRCDINDDEAIKLQKECENAYQWKSLERTAKWFYHHWFLRNIVDIIDILCRSQIVQFINDNFIDLGISNAKYMAR